MLMNWSAARCEAPATTRSARMYPPANRLYSTSVGVDERFCGAQVLVGVGVWRGINMVRQIGLQGRNLPRGRCYARSTAAHVGGCAGARKKPWGLRFMSDAD